MRPEAATSGLKKRLAFICIFPLLNTASPKPQSRPRSSPVLIADPLSPALRLCINLTLSCFSGNWTIGLGRLVLVPAFGREFFEA